MFRDIGERAIAVVAVKRVLFPASQENVFESVVVVIANGDAVEIARAEQACTLGYIRECAVTIVLVKAVGSIRRRLAKTGPGKNQDIEPAVVVVVEERGAAAHSLEDVVGVPRVAGDHRMFQPGLLRDVGKPCVKRKTGELAPGSGFDSARSHSPLCIGALPQKARGWPNQQSEKITPALPQHSSARIPTSAIQRKEVRCGLPEYFESQLNLAAAVICGRRALGAESTARRSLV